MKKHIEPRFEIEVLDEQHCCNRLGHNKKTCQFFNMIDAHCFCVLFGSLKWDLKTNLVEQVRVKRHKKCVFSQVS